MSDIIHNLMIKTHMPTGIKYLCYSVRKGEFLEKYKGSGTEWRKLIREHKSTINDIHTEYILQTDDYELLKRIAISSSIEYDIVESATWANLKIECGEGGSTSTGKKWVTDGINDKYILNSEKLPDGWFYGRSKCVFNDVNKQKEFSALGDRTKAGNATKEFHKKRRADGIAWGEWMHRDGAQNTNAKQIITPAGEFGCIEDARKHHNMTMYRIRKNIKTNPEQWKVINE